MSGSRLFLHFDVNKTIIMSDVVSGRSVEETLNSLLSECTWGVCADKPFDERCAGDWVVCSDIPSSEPPAVGAITLGSYLEDNTAVPKKEQTKIKRAFADTGAIGERFRPFRDQLNDALKHSNLDLSKNDLPYLSTGYYHIVPSFFRLVEYLAESNIDFNILFRTFGVDIENVCEEFNLFCVGQHPAYVPSRRLDGTDAIYKKDLRLKLPSFHGKFSHTGSGSEGLHMRYMARDANECTVSGAHDVYKVIMGEWFGIIDTATEAQTHCAAIQDDFGWWHQNAESEHSGKLLLVDHMKSGETAQSIGQKGNVVQVFFDDNIERDRAHIVDVRDARTYAPVPFEEARGRYLRRVEPYGAILDRDYYVKEVQAVLAMHAAL